METMRGKRGHLLLTRPILAELERNAKKAEHAEGRFDPEPVVKLFCPYSGATWLFTEIRGDTLFGLCDLGQGFPELGYASFSELEALRTSWGGPAIERDLYFKPTKTLSAYAADANELGHVRA